MQAMRALSLREVQALARDALPPEVYDYYAGGADDETTLAANEAAYARLRLLPRVLRGTAPARLETELLGSRTEMPVLIAPTAFHCLAHPEGERATARVAAEAGVVMVTGMASTVAVEELKGPTLWFQLYPQPDLAFTADVIRRAEEAGCTALVVTVDSPVFGRHERDLRNGFLDLPSGLRCPNMAGRDIAFWPGFGWRELARLRASTRLPVVLKGVLHPDDARTAVAEGADAVLVSNHGGRQLDTVPATIELLPAVADAVGGAVPVLVDGGVRRGTDVVKALALGAGAVAVGRPVLWGLAAGGADGVLHVLRMLRDELAQALTLCGCGSAQEAGRGLVHPQPGRRLYVEEGPCLPS